MKKTIGYATLIALTGACGAQGLDLGEDRSAAMGNDDAGPVASSDESANDVVPNAAPQQTEDNVNNVGGQNPVPSPFGESSEPESDEPPAPIGNLNPSPNNAPVFDSPATPLDPTLPGPTMFPTPPPAPTADVAPCPPVANSTPQPANPTAPSPSTTSSNGTPVNSDPPDPCHPLPEAGPMGPQPGPSNSSPVPNPTNPGPTMVPTPEDPGICDTFTECAVIADCAATEDCLAGYCFPSDRPVCGGAAGWTCEGDTFTECVYIVGDFGVCMAQDEVECYSTRSDESGEADEPEGD